MKKTLERRGKEGRIVFLAAVLMIAGMAAVYILIGRGMEGQMDRIPEGVLLKLEEPLESSDLEQAGTKGYQVKSLGASENGGQLYQVTSKNEKPVLLNQVSDFTENLFGRPFDGESLNLSSHRRMTGQAGVLAWLAAIGLASVILLIVSIRKLGRLQEKQWGQGLEGILMIAFWLVLVYYITGRLQIPREFLPPEQILDLRFYVNGIRDFFVDNKWSGQALYQTIRACYLKELEVYGSWAACAWIGTLIISGFAGTESRKRKKRIERT